MNRTRLVGPLLVLLLALAGCGTGQVGTPDLDRARIGLDSVDGRVGPLRLLSVAIASPGTRGSLHIAGNSAALLLTVANDGEADDELTGVTAGVAEEVVLRNGDDEPAPRIEVDVPSGGVAVLREVTGLHLELSGLRETLRSGFSVPVVFEFRDAGSVTLEVPIHTYTDVRPDRFTEPAAAATR
ncbi:copper chaperone PCu(A)C [Geodermatophilus sp. CPCC 206100]|uniref:copper chaperone PCu(A)C n=1 Tax=Geodermatophilus sp. CPCC 206100 TaxID=3020054 RepID=UPI003AFFA54F